MPEFSNNNLMAMAFSLISAVVVAFAGKASEWWVTSNSQHLQDSILIRKELREEIASLKAEVKISKDEIETWKEKFHTIKTESGETVLKYELLNAKYVELKNEYDALVIKYEKVHQELGSIKIRLGGR